MCVPVEITRYNVPWFVDEKVLGDECIQFGLGRQNGALDSLGIADTVQYAHVLPTVLIPLLRDLFDPVFRGHRAASPDTAPDRG